MRFTASIAAALLQSALVAGDLEFNRDIRPILSENCFACHGPDEKARKAEVRLDVSGADWAEVMRRVNSTDPDEIMPPPESHKKPLATGQVAALKQWIAEGAKYQRHWAFEPPLARGGDSIDDFVKAKLSTKGLSLAPRATPETLMRRVSLDLTGLPPALSDLSGKNHEAHVDRLLNSPHFGEHMAVAWLDAARYADTNGYFGDKPRSAWPWRDWVINAFNANMPFDQFTIEQLAGDLLPKPTRDQLVATGFCRNSMANDEGGIDDEEFRVEFIVDRLDAISNTWMGLSLGCAQCHDHKYDPISQREFYQVFAFFNNSPETGLTLVSKPQVTLPVPTRAQELETAKLKTARLAAEKAFKAQETQIAQNLADWSKSLVSTKPASTRTGTIFSLKEHPDRVRAIGDVSHEKGIEGDAARFDNTQHLEVDGSLGLDAEKPWSIALWMRGEDYLSCVFSKVEPSDEKRGLEVIWLKGALQVNLVHRWGIDAIEVMANEPLDRQDWNLVVLSYDGSCKAAGLKLCANGREVPLKVNRDTLTGSIANSEPLRIGRRDKNLGFYGLIDDLRVFNRVVSLDEAAEWFTSARSRFIAQKTEKERSTKEKDWLLEQFVTQQATPEQRAGFESLKQARQREVDHSKSIPTALVMRENAKPRDTRMLMRGQWDAPGEKVTANVPAALPPLRAEWSRDRLGFARWLVSPENPLTARVIVNRLWQQCFGEGLVRTVNDFGSQGEAPTHPELLDWLAVKFVKSGWDVKALLKLIVMSETYQQRSQFPVGGSKLDDPENRLLARGPSFRLSAEALRDQALAVAGLLSPRVGGPSVRPWQPPGVWEAVSYNAEETYVPDTGENAYRRTLYSYWKRQAPPPATLTFDGPTREKCSVRRARTNTPLQALVMLNDENFMRAAEALAKRSEGQNDRIAWMFRAATCREATADELELLRGLFERQKSLTIVAQTILNLDEVITRR